MTDLTVILPTKNEVDSLGKVITEVRESLGADTPILVVDTKSTDGTLELAESMGVKIIKEPRPGKGVAIATGILNSFTPYLAVINSDFTYPASYLASVYRLMSWGKYDCVFGCRSLREKDSMSFSHSLYNWFVSLLASMLFGKRVTDICTGLKAFRTDKVKEFELNTQGFEVEAELFTEMVERRLNFVEIPIAYRKRNGGSSKISMVHGFEIIWFLVKRRLV